MPCYSPSDDVVACKLVSVYPSNGKLGISSHIVYVLLFQASSGKLLSIMEGESITKRRTAATSALSAKWLAPKNPKILSILGAGHQALAHMQVLLDQYPGLKQIKLWNYRKSSAIRLAEEVSGWLTKEQWIEVFDEVDECVQDADLIVTATFATKPVLKGTKLRSDDVHLMSVGAPRPDWSEIEPEVWNASQVYVDSFAGAQAESGDIINSQCSIVDELGSIFGNSLNTGSKNQRTIFKSLGLAVEDLVAAKMVFEKSKKGSKCPLKFLELDHQDYLGEDIFIKDQVNTKVKNFEANAILSEDFEVRSLSQTLSHDLMVCEIKTEATNFTLLYKAQTGELKAIIDTKKMANYTLHQRLGNYFNLKIK